MPLSKNDPVVEANLMIYRYMNRTHEQQNLVEWKIQMYLHDKKSTGLSYHDDWKKLMDVTEEIEKDIDIVHVTVSGKGTVIKQKSGGEVFVKVSTDIDKKKACWSTIVKYLEKLKNNSK